MTGIDNQAMVRQTKLNDFAITIELLLRRPHVPRITCYAKTVISTFANCDFLSFLGLAQKLLTRIYRFRYQDREGYFQVKSGMIGIFDAIVSSHFRQALYRKGDSGNINQKCFTSLHQIY